MARHLQQWWLCSRAGLHSWAGTNRKVRSSPGRADNFHQGDSLTQSDSSGVQRVGRATANKDQGKSDLQEHCSEGTQMSTLLQYLKVGLFAF